MISTKQTIYAQQKSWANKHHKECDKNGYTLKLTDNLYLPLSGDVEAEFRNGQGHELDNKGKPGHMHALISSSALVVNFFSYWRYNNRISDIATACGMPPGITKMQFEQLFPTGLKGNSPEPDMLFTGSKLRPIAVECKFTETYQRHTKREINRKYLDPKLWMGLRRCHDLINALNSEQNSKIRFVYLDTPQLLKHILGLTKTFGGPDSFDLLYIWYEFRSLEADKHREEISELRRYIGHEVNLIYTTYQEVFENVRRYPKVDPDYISYLTERYFYNIN